MPPKALRSATAITLAPIASIADLPICRSADLPSGASLAGGAHLTPERQAFDIPLKLTIALARPPSWPGGSQTYTEFREEVLLVTIPITLRHGDIVRLEGIASAAEFSSTQNSADASGSYSIWVDPIPGVLRVIPANCPPL